MHGSLGKVGDGERGEDVTVQILFPVCRNGTPVGVETAGYLTWSPFMVYSWLWALSGDGDVQQVRDFVLSYLGGKAFQHRDAAQLVLCT